MRAKVTNTSKADQGVYGVSGLLYIAAGTARKLTIADNYVDRARSLPFLIVRELGDDATFDEGELASPDARAENDPLASTSSSALAAAMARAEEAEARAADLSAENDTLKAKLAAFDHDGDGNPGGGVNAESATDDSVKTALELLDPAKDDDWTAAGLPAVDAVATLAGGKVTRAQIEAIAPGLTRETAAKG